MAKSVIDSSFLVMILALIMHLIIKQIISLYQNQFNPMARQCLIKVDCMPGIGQPFRKRIEDSESKKVWTVCFGGVLR